MGYISAEYALGIEGDGEEYVGLFLSASGEHTLFHALSESELVERVRAAVGAKKFHEACVVTTLSLEQVVVRSLTIPLQRASEVDAVLAAESEPHIPYPLEEASVGRQIIASTQQGTEVTLFAAKRVDVERHVEERSVEPEVITSVPVAVAAFGRRWVQEQPMVILHVTHSALLAVAIEEGQVVEACHIAGGLGELAEELALRSLPVEEWGSVLDSSKLRELDRLRQQAVRVVLALGQRHSATEGWPLFVTGLGAEFAHLDDYLSRHLERDLLEVKIDTALRSAAVAAGSAEVALHGGEALVNFRKGNLGYSRPWKRVQRPLLLGGAGLLVLLLSCVLLTQEWLSMRTNALRQEYTELVAVLDMRIEEIEREIGEPLPPEELRAQDIEERIAAIRRLTKGEPESFALRPDVPRVSDLLAWLAAHPAVQEEGVELESLHYVMVKRPTKQRPADPYQVRVDLDFTAKNPEIARTLYDALSGPHPLVDGTKEVKWQAANGRYKTSFYLQDHTYYP